MPPIKIITDKPIVYPTPESLERFAALVAAHKAEVAIAEAYRCGYDAGAAAEREECANLCEQWNASHPDALAIAIRARSQS